MTDDDFRISAQGILLTALDAHHAVVEDGP